MKILPATIIMIIVFFALAALLLIINSMIIGISLSTIYGLSFFPIVRKLLGDTYED